jgi:hypothetical protein
MGQCVACGTITRQRAAQLIAGNSIAAAHADALEKARPNLAVAFRRHIMGMSPGDPITWKDMDIWTKAQRPFSEWIPDPGNPFYWDDPWNDFTVDCMVICEAMAREGWLRPTSALEFKLYDLDRSKWQPEADEYIRNDKRPGRQRTISP